ncbi:MAG: spermine synthase [Proteobacteria bacterium]|nr:spermine synthase [Pseudomonadota bacterium]
MIHSLRASLIIMGVSGIVAQIILLREFLVSFFGNELTLGIILANWLILEAIGAFYIGKSVEKTERKIENYVLLQLIFSLAFPFAVYLSRVFKNFLLITPGEGLGFAPIFYSSFLILLPVTVSHGALFTFGCKIYSQYAREDASSIGKVYVLETIGSIIGGLLLTFLMIQYFNSFEIAFIISLVNTLISIFLLWPRRIPSLVHLRNGLWSLSIFLALLFAYVLFTPISGVIHVSSVLSQWRNMDVIHNENSIYGNITVTKRGEQFTFFTDGVPSITAPVPDIASIEDFVHFPMLFHEQPDSVLILSGGAGGMIHEILKYPVTHIHYVELDPLLLKLVLKFSTPLTQSELSDHRVNIHYTDGRFFVQKTQDRFDIMFIGLPVPGELQTNRFFSSEFFSVARRRMNPDGIIVLTLPGSLTYINPELRDLNRCILDTLKGVYPSVRIIPGDVNLYLASESTHLKEVTAEEVAKRLEGRNIKTSLFTKGYIAYRLHERWLKWFSKSMEGGEVRLNSDFRPLGVFFNLSYWNALFSPYLVGVFRWFEGISLRITVPLMACLTLLFGGIFVKRPWTSRYSVPYAIFTTGLTGMIFDLAIIFTFQTLYGYLYYQIGLLVTTFMVGVALSGLWVTQRLEGIRKDLPLFLGTELCIALFSVLLPFVFSIPSQYLDKTAIYILLYMLFLTMSLLSGALVGFQFPLANKIYLSTTLGEGTFGRAAGLLYGADLFGGFFGGVLGGVLLLPILGLKESCFMMAIIKISSFLLILLFTRIRK